MAFLRCGFSWRVSETDFSARKQMDHATNRFYEVSRDEFEQRLSNNERRVEEESVRLLKAEVGAIGLRDY